MQTGPKSTFDCACAEYKEVCGRQKNYQVPTVWAPEETEPEQVGMMVPSVCLWTGS